MDDTRQFGFRELIVIGVLSGIAVSLVKAIQAGFHFGSLAVETYAALLTYAAYLVLGAIGAVFLVDHDAKGQKMLKSAFLMGFVAPSFFLALLNNPNAGSANLKDILGRVPKISEYFVSSAFAQVPPRSGENANERAGTKASNTEFEKAGIVVRTLEKSEVQPSFAAAIKKALGASTSPKSFTYVVGTTDDLTKAMATASQVHKILSFKGSTSEPWVQVVQPEGKSSYFITVGDIGSPEKAVGYGDWTKDAAIKHLGSSGTDEGKRIATFMLKGQVIDARAMFAERF